MGENTNKEYLSLREQIRKKSGIAEEKESKKIQFLATQGL